MSIKKANKVSSIPRSILLYESIVDIDIDTSKVSSIISTSISIFDINNPGASCHGVRTIIRKLWKSVFSEGVRHFERQFQVDGDVAGNRSMDRWIGE